MRRLLLLSSLLVVALVMGACDSFVESVDQPKDTAGSPSFTDDQEARFLLRGVQAQWADAHDLTSTTADFLSDQFRFGLNGDATFPTFGQLDRGRPQEQNNSVDAALNAVGEYRFLADDLLRRANEIEFTDQATASETELRYVGNLHGAIARHYYATYFGLNPREGGGVIDTSEFIPSPSMYQRAETKYAEALSQAQSLGEGAFVGPARAQKIVQSLRARSALYAGTHDFDASGGLQGDAALQMAATYASEGLVEGDAPYSVPYTVQDPNEYADQAGRQRLQMVAQDGFLLNETVSNSNAYRRDEDGSLLVRSWITDVILQNPNELARVPLASIRGGPSFTALTQENAGEEINLWFELLQGNEPEDAPFEFAQDKYQEDSAIPVITWQEMYLIRAELELRGYDTGSESALELVNAVRSSFGLSDRSSVNLDVIAVERDRTLFAEGQRLPDQRRLDGAPWHLNETVEGGTTWQWLPITRQELDNNPNL